MTSPSTLVIFGADGQITPAPAPRWHGVAVRPTVFTQGDRAEGPRNQTFTARCDGASTLVYRHGISRSSPHIAVPHLLAAA